MRGEEPTPRWGASGPSVGEASGATPARVQAAPWERPTSRLAWTSRPATRWSSGSSLTRRRRGAARCSPASAASAASSPSLPGSTRSRSSSAAPTAWAPSSSSPSRWTSHDTVGIDLVAMSVNDVLTCGAEPLFFLDYFATARLDVERAEKVIAGVAEGLRAGGLRAARRRDGRAARLLRARASTTWPASRWASSRSRSIIDGKQIVPGDRVLGLASSGLHSNGYSLARRDPRGRAPRAHRLASTAWHLGRGAARAHAHLREGHPRAARGGAGQGPGAHHRRRPARATSRAACPTACARCFKESSWKRPPIFDVLAAPGRGAIATRCSAPSTWALGMTVVVRARAGEAGARAARRRAGVSAWDVGVIEARQAREPRPRPSSSHDARGRAGLGQRLELRSALVAGAQRRGQPRRAWSSSSATCPARRCSSARARSAKVEAVRDRSQARPQSRAASTWPSRRR